MNVQGDVIRDIDGSAMNSNSHGRRGSFADSDDEDAPTSSAAKQRSNMDIYRQRQQKRAKH